MSKKNTDTPDRKRQLLAQETARIVVNQGIRDYRSAKTKAADKLGLRNYGSLPGNVEIESAINDHLQLFGRESHADLLAVLRRSAVSAMTFLSDFEPRLVGPVLNGTADENSPVNLHLFCDSPEVVATYLSDHKVSYRSYDRRLRTRRDQTGTLFAGFAFKHDEADIEATVFPVDGIRQAPISAVGGKPMKRADAKAVGKLLDQR